MCFLDVPGVTQNHILQVNLFIRKDVENTGLGSYLSALIIFCVSLFSNVLNQDDGDIAAGNTLELICSKEVLMLSTNFVPDYCRVHKLSGQSQSFKIDELYNQLSVLSSDEIQV